jgi:large subunit ribosomal protein L16
MFQPPKRKFRKDRKGRNRGSFHNPKIAFGDYGLQSLGHARLTARQIEAARRAIARHVKRGGKLWIRIFPDKPISKKPLEVRQGKGKGSVEYYVMLVKPGTVLFEITGVSKELAMSAFRLAAAKLPVKSRFIEKMVIEDAKESA